MIRSSPYCRDVQVDPREVTVELETDEQGVAELLRQLVSQGVPVRSYADKDPTLEDVFMMVTRSYWALSKIEITLLMISMRISFFLIARAVSMAQYILTTTQIILTPTIATIG